MGVSAKWHIEAWSVRDGMAFASLRPAGQVLKAERTVFIGAPSLDVVPLGSVSPALWATRANFQAGLWGLSEGGAEGERAEIGFDTLQQVRELVRRGYLAGGMGPGAAEGGPQLPEGGPNGSPDVGRRLDEAYKHLYADDIYQSLRLASPALRREFFGWLARPGEVPRVREGLRTFAASVIELWTNQLASSDFPLRGRSDLGRLVWAVIRHLGLWPDPMEARFYLERHTHASLINHPDFRGIFDSWHYGINWITSTPDDLVFLAPCPVLPSGDRRIARLSDKLLQFVLTATKPDQSLSMADFVPAILAALLITAEAPLPIWTVRDHDFAERLRIALDWMSAQMPQHMLPQQAGAALDRFVDQQLKPA